MTVKITGINATLGCSEPERTAIIAAWGDQVNLERDGEYGLDILGAPEHVIALLATVGCTSRADVVKQIVAAAEAL